MTPASPKRRQHWQRSVSAGYPQYSLAHAFLYCCIALWFNTPAAAAIKYKEPFSADELITPLDDITREPVGFPKQDNFVLLLKKTKDPPSLNDDLLPNLNPDVDIILTNSLAHLSEDIVYTIKQTAITDFSYLVIDTSTQIMKSGCIFLLSQDVRIKDTLSKWFMTLKGKVCASSLQGSININYKDKYTLSLYSRNYNIICTFKNVANNLYLAYEGGILTLKAMPTGELCSDTSIFYFNIMKDPSMTYSFSPVKNPKHFISTSRKNSAPVTMQLETDYTYIMDFEFESNIYGGILKAGSNGLAIILKKGFDVYY